LDLGLAGSIHEAGCQGQPSRMIRFVVSQGFTEEREARPAGDAGWRRLDSPASRDSRRRGRAVAAEMRIAGDLRAAEVPDPVAVVGRRDARGVERDAAVPGYLLHESSHRQGNVEAEPNDRSRAVYDFLIRPVLALSLQPGELKGGSFHLDRQR